MEIEYPDGEFKDKPQAELCVWCVAREVLRIFLEAPENPFFGLVRRRRAQAETTQAIGAPSSGKALIPAVWGLPAESECQSDCEDTREDEPCEAAYFLKAHVCSSQLCWRSNHPRVTVAGFFTVSEAALFSFDSSM